MKLTLATNFVCVINLVCSKKVKGAVPSWGVGGVLISHSRPLSP